MSFKGFKEFEFFHYRNSHTLDYHIIEARSGMSVGKSWDSLQKAKLKAEKNLTKTGVEAFQKMIDKQIEKHGLSPRYTEGE